MAKEGHIGKGVLTRRSPGNYAYTTKYRHENGNIQLNEYDISKHRDKWYVSYFYS